MSNTLSGDTIRRMAEVLTRDHKIKVTFGAECTATDGQTIMLPALPEIVSSEVLARVCAWLDHESSHILFKTNFKLFEHSLQKYGQAASFMLNALEDVRCEAEMAQVWKGAGLNMAEGAEVVRRMQEERAAAGDEQVTHPLKQLAIISYSRGRGAPDPKWLDRKWIGVADNYGQRLRSITQWAKKTEDLLPLALELAAEYEKAKEQPPQPPPPEDEEGEGEGDGTGQGQGKGSGQGKAKGEGDGSDSADTGVGAGDGASPDTAPKGKGAKASPPPELEDYSKELAQVANEAINEARQSDKDEGRLWIYEPTGLDCEEDHIELTFEQLGGTR
jgi:hypothetical protein